MKRVLKMVWNNPRSIFPKLWELCSPIIPSDEVYTKIRYRLYFGKKLNLDNPQTYNEKLQWLKLYDHNPLYSRMVDKYAVKKLVADKIGEKYIIPTLGVWASFDDIDYNTLPNQFVLKTTMGGGNSGVVICKDKSKFEKKAAKKKLERSLKSLLYKRTREWPYRDVPPRIIAEKYIESNAGDLPDYKFFCFDGEVKAMFIATDRFSGNVKFDYFDADFNHLDLIQVHPMSGKMIQCPEEFDEMKRIASELSKGLPEVRVDLYDVDGKIYFGELTFFHHGGVVPFHPESWDYEFGSWVKLPEKRD